MSELSEFQKEVGEWGDETFHSKRDNKEENMRGIVNHIERQVVDLINACSGLFDLGVKEIAHEEAADCFILLLQLSHVIGFDLLLRAKEKMEINRGREWPDSPDNDGVFEHIKEAK